MTVSLLLGRNKPCFILLRILCCPSLEFLFVFVRRIGSVFNLRIFTRKGCSPAVRLEELGRRIVASNFEDS